MSLLTSPPLGRPCPPQPTFQGLGWYPSCHTCTWGSSWGGRNVCLFSQPWAGQDRGCCPGPSLLVGEVSLWATGQDLCAFKPKILFGPEKSVHCIKLSAQEQSGMWKSVRGSRVWGASGSVPLGLQSVVMNPAVCSLGLFSNSQPLRFPQIPRAGR